MAELDENPSASARAASSADPGRWILVFATMILLAAVTNRAWVTEDAYITFRTVDNFVNGYGLRWNVDERVQAFTHPLWMFLHVPFYAIFRDIFLITLGLSLACTGGAWWVANRFRPTAWAPALLLLPLVWSRAFCDYGTSGLENPLTFLLCALFVDRLERGAGRADGDLRALALIAALAVTNRFDTILLYTPIIAWRLLSATGASPARRVFLTLTGAAPFLAWEAFSLLYYGFAFPNTKYAKLSTGIESSAYVDQGLAYTMDLVVRDPASAATVGAGLALGAAALLQGARALRSEGRAGLGAPEVGGLWERGIFATGLLAYVAYVVWVGGDFMAGRFWSLPVFASALILHRTLVSAPAPALAAAGLALVAAFPRDEWRQVPLDATSAGIMDERSFWAETNGIEAYQRGGGVQENKHSRAGLQVRAQIADNPGARYTTINTTVGMFGFYAGPEAVIIDKGALADPLLARIPLEDTEKWRPGHFFRYPPRGYEEVRRTGDISKLHPEVQAYYQNLWQVVAGDLFSAERLTHIIKFNLGMYDNMLDTYNAGRRAQRAAQATREETVAPSQPAPARAETSSPAAGAATADDAAPNARQPGKSYPFGDASTPKADHTPWDAAGNFIIPPGVELSFVVDPPRSARELEFSADAKDLYTFVFYRGEMELGSVTVAKVPGKHLGLANRTVSLPQGAIEETMDRIGVYADGDGRFGVGHLVLK